ncbi:MAG: transglutaminase-like domain-containing protein [Candidatus Cryosericum sp.]
MLLNSIPPNQAGPAQPAKSSLGFIPEGPAGIVVTLDMMSKIVRQYKTSLTVRNLATSITQQLPGKDYRGEIEAVQRWVKNNIRYVRDVSDVETLQTPEALLQSRSGDCDDQAMMVATLLESIGHPTGFVAVGFSPNEYDHVYAITRLGTAWLSVETTENVPIGWRPDNVVSHLVKFN